MNVTCSIWNEIRNLTDGLRTFPHGYQYARSLFILVTTLRFDIPQSVLTQNEGSWSLKQEIDHQWFQWRMMSMLSYLCLSHMLRFPCNAIGPISKRGPWRNYIDSCRHRLPKRGSRIFEINPYPYLCVTREGPVSLHTHWVIYHHKDALWRGSWWYLSTIGLVSFIRREDFSWIPYLVFIFSDNSVTSRAQKCDRNLPLNGKMLRHSNSPVTRLSAWNLHTFSFVSRAQNRGAIKW